MMGIKRIDTNKYLDFLAMRDYLEELIVKTGRKVLCNEDFNIKFTSKNHIIEYHKKYI
ncbi:hypothetical protein ES708_12998 [subsurface metagenome]